jgi:hypothetical protein
VVGQRLLCLRAHYWPCRVVAGPRILHAFQHPHRDTTFLRACPPARGLRAAKPPVGGSRSTGATSATRRTSPAQRRRTSASPRPAPAPVNRASGHAVHHSPLTSRVVEALRTRCSGLAQLVRAADRDSVRAIDRKIHTARRSRRPRRNRRASRDSIVFARQTQSRRRPRTVAQTVAVRFPFVSKKLASVVQVSSSGLLAISNVFASLCVASRRRRG